MGSNPKQQCLAKAAPHGVRESKDTCGWKPAFQKKERERKKKRFSMPNGMFVASQIIWPRNENHPAIREEEKEKGAGGRGSLALF